MCSPCPVPCPPHVSACRAHAAAWRWAATTPRRGALAQRRDQAVERGRYCGRAGDDGFPVGFGVAAHQVEADPHIGDRTVDDAQRSEVFVGLADLDPDLHLGPEHLGGDAVGFRVDGGAGERAARARVLEPLVDAVGGVVGEAVVVTGDALEGCGDRVEGCELLDVVVRDLGDRAGHGASGSVAGAYRASDPAAGRPTCQHRGVLRDGQNG